MVLEGVLEGEAEALLVKDCVAASGGFVLHWILKKLLSSIADGSRVVFVALNSPFIHYARIAKKQGCNLVSSMEKGHLAFIDLFSDPSTWKYSCTSSQDKGENALIVLYKRINEALKNVRGTAHIIFDDISLLEVIVQGSKHRVLDFLHYCRALPCGQHGKRCSVIMLVHEDIYTEDDESLTYLMELEHSSKVIIQVQPLTTGHASDVHGQISVVYRDLYTNQQNVKKHFKVNEASVDFFLPGKHFKI